MRRVLTIAKVATFPVLWPVHVARFWLAPIKCEEQAWPVVIHLPAWTPNRWAA